MRTWEQVLFFFTFAKGNSIKILAHGQDKGLNRKVFSGLFLHDAVVCLLRFGAADISKISVASADKDF